MMTLASRSFVVLALLALALAPALALGPTLSLLRGAGAAAAAAEAATTAAAVGSSSSLSSSDAVTADALNLGTKTPYPISWSATVPPPLSTPPGCSILHFNHLGRHGARHMSSSKDLTKLMTSVQKLQGDSHNKTMLAQWVAAALSIEHDSDIGQLSYAGRREQAGIARRMVDNFGSFFKATNTNGRKIHMESSAIQRTIDSRHTAELTFQALGLNNTHTPVPEACVSGQSPSKTHSLYKFFDDCAASVAFRTQMESAPLDQPGLAQFGAPVRAAINFPVQVIDAWFKRSFAGMADTWSADDKEKFVSRVWSSCQVEWGSMHNAFDLCSFFTKVDRDAFVIFEDLEKYIERGPTRLGNYVSSKSACWLLNDIIQRAADAIADPKKSHAVSMRWAHAETILPLVALLGWFTDPTIVETNPQSWLNPNRLWKDGVISTMSANLQFVLYQCGDEPKLAILHNEVPMPFPASLGCSDRTYCQWSRASAWLKSLSCSYNDFFATVCGGLAPCSDELRHSSRHLPRMPRAATPTTSSTR